MPRHTAFGFAALLASAVLLAGCSGLPTAGPQASQLVSRAHNAEARRLGVVLVDVTPTVVQVLKQEKPPSLNQAFGQGTPFVPAIGVGDAVAVTIWEAGSGSLFSTPVVTGQPMVPSHGTVLPVQVVQPDGAITVPYAGRVPVVGLSPPQAEAAIRTRLLGKAIDPQVMVQVQPGAANSVMVTGGGSGGARVPLSVKGDRVLDAIAQVGGIRVSMDDAVIMVTRGAKTVAVPYAAILRDPNENIYLKGGDVLTVVARPPTFLALGAVQRNGQISFDADTISVSEAVAKSAGLSDSRSDPSGVFLFRFEPPALVRRLAPYTLGTVANGPVPVIYRFDFRDPSQMFLAGEFAMKDKDMLYVASAPLNDLEKFFTVIGSVLSPAGTALGVGAAVTTLSH